MHLPHPVKKILITNIVSLNPGDAAILKGTIAILRQRYGSDVDIVVFDKFASAAKKYYPWASFRQALFPQCSKGFLGRILERAGYSHWSERMRFLCIYVSVYLLKHEFPVIARLLLDYREIEDLREYVSADLILSSGGTYLIENYNLAHAIRDYRISKIAGKRFGFFTQTLGPFRSKKNKSAFKKIFSNASIILLRDERSKQHILELGVEPRNIHLAADAAFVLAKTVIDARVDSGKASQFSTSPRVAISVRNMNNFHFEHSNAYFEGISKIVQVAVEEFDAQVTFVSTCQGIAEYWTNDADTAEEICKLLPDNLRDQVKVDRDFRQPWEVVDVYQTYDAVIATRMHAAILSLCAGTPTMGIAYEFKTVELFNNVNMPDLVLSVSDFSEDNVKEVVNRLLCDLVSNQKKARLASAKMYKEAWKAEKVLPELD